MAKRNLDQILEETLPEKSKVLYQKRWVSFLAYMGEPARRPLEIDFLQYFDYLRTEKKLESSTIWSIYSSLNSLHQREYGEKLQVYPRVTQLLKTYNSSYVRKVASTFQKDELDCFLKMELTSAYWIVRKAVVSLAICGGLRCAEIREINFTDVAEMEGDFEVTVVRKKQRGEKKESKFLVCFPFSSHLSTYLATVRGALGDSVTGPLIKGVPKGLVNQPMGRTYLANIGKDVARVLKLENS